MGSASMFGSLFSLLFLIVPFVLAYFVIKLAVRHGIDSSEVGRILKEKHNDRLKDE